MDLESEFSALESVEDNEAVVSQATATHVDDDNVKNNGSCSYEINESGTSDNHAANNIVPLNNHEKHVDSVKPLDSPSLAIKSAAGVSPSTTKGYGLKKWRRIRRDFVKDTGPSLDSSKILKRGLSGPVNQAKPLPSQSAELRQNSEGSVGSANVVKNVGSVDGFATRGSSLDSRSAVGSAFVAGTDSENSEDRSSKSSTAASAPKMRFDLPAVSGHARERNRIKNLSGKSGSNSTQRVQQGKIRAESSKKPRGEKVKIEKENSLSSMESDSRSSNFVFLQGAFSVTSNGKQSGRTMNYDGENSDDAHACEQQFSVEVQTGYTKEKVEEVEDLSQDDLAADLSWDAKGEKCEDKRLSIDRDPLAESILALQSVQEALEKEVQKFGEIGKNATSLNDNAFKDSSVPAPFTFTDSEIHGPSSSEKLGYEKIKGGASNSLEVQVLSLKENVKYLENKLEDARAMLKVKESKVAELETALSSSKPLKDESGSTIKLRPEKCRETETELEGLFRQKIEAEIEYLALLRTIDRLRDAVADPITLFEGQVNLAEEQEQMLSKLGEADSKVTVLKKQAEELEKYCGDILGNEVVLKMQKRVCKLTSYFSMQLILLVFVFWLLQLSPHSGVVVPT